MVIERSLSKVLVEKIGKCSQLPVAFLRHAEKKQKQNIVKGSDPAKVFPSDNSAPQSTTELRTRMSAAFQSDCFHKECRHDQDQDHRCKERCQRPWGSGVLVARIRDSDGLRMAWC